MIPGMYPKHVKMRLMNSWPQLAVLRKTASGGRKIAVIDRIAVPRPIVKCVDFEVDTVESGSMTLARVQIRFHIPWC